MPLSYSHQHCRRMGVIAVARSWNSRVISSSVDGRLVARRSACWGEGAGVRYWSTLICCSHSLLTTPHLPPWATHQLSVWRIACSGSGTKNVLRPDRTDVVPGRNSTRNGSGTITSHKQILTPHAISYCNHWRQLNTVLYRSSFDHHWVDKSVYSINQSINLYRAIVQRCVLQCGYAESKRNVLRPILNVLTDGAVRQFSEREFQSLYHLILPPYINISDMFTTPDHVKMLQRYSHDSIGMFLITVTSRTVSNRSLA